MSRPSIASSSKWVFAGTVVTRPLQLFTNVLLARLLGPANYGVMGLATSLAVTLALLTSFGFGDAMTKFVAEYYQRDKQKGALYASIIFWGSLLFSILLFAALWLTQDRWSPLVFPAGVTRTTASLCLCLALMNLIAALILGALTGLQLFRDVTLYNLLQATAMVVLALFVGYSINGALVVYIAGNAACIGWGITKLWMFDSRIFRLPSVFDWLSLKTIIRFSTPIWIGYFALNPVVTYAFAFLARQRNGPYELGLFSTALSLRSLVIIIPGVVGAVISPALIQEAGVHGERGAYETLLKNSFMSLVFLTLPLLVLFVFLADFIFRIYGRDFGSAYLLFAPLAGSAAIGAIGAPLITILTAKNRTWWALGFGILKSLALVLLALWWIPSNFSTGLAWAFVISEASFYVIATEFCIGIGIMPAGIRKVFYSACFGVAAIVLLGMELPDMARWIAALPFGAALAALLVRSYPALASWLENSLPHPLRPRAQSILSFITS